ncbi:transmembrane protein 238-like [Cheilinus undulatus]|uniref:transmembrane protein 238-like n=1 Tax=Cheilinus undulatus TaxID=241271 RepID=UPI001BD29F1D|nr:transmembrane protein 238-like [Cheilinus undulatus]
MERLRCIGGCVPMFLVAVVFDVIGLVLLFIGIFANLRIEGRFYGDFLIYTGSLIVFFSVGPWLMWYVGNVQVSVEDGSKKRGSTIVRLARKLSERLSQKLRGEDKTVRGVPDHLEDHGNQVSPAPHKASRVTWGRATAYQNGGFDGTLDPKDPDKKEDEGKQEMILQI